MTTEYFRSVINSILRDDLRSGESFGLFSDIEDYGCLIAVFTAFNLELMIGNRLYFGFNLTKSFIALDSCLQIIQSKRMYQEFDKDNFSSTIVIKQFLEPQTQQFRVIFSLLAYADFYRMLSCYSAGIRDGLKHTLCGIDE